MDRTSSGVLIDADRGRKKSAHVIHIVLTRRGNNRSDPAVSLGQRADVGRERSHLLSLIHHHEFDSGRTGAMGAGEVDAISAYIRANGAGARYEFAAADPTEVASLIIHDRLPILSLTSYGPHELLPITRLAALVASGQLRFAVLDGRYCWPVAEA